MIKIIKLNNLNGVFSKNDEKKNRIIYYFELNI